MLFFDLKNIPDVIVDSNVVDWLILRMSLFNILSGEIWIYFICKLDRFVTFTLSVLFKL